MRKQTKVVAVASAAALLAIGASMTSFAATGWVEEDGQWYYYDKDGVRVEDEWKKSGDNWYWMDSEEGGAMATDKLIEDGDNIYYVDANGVMVKNTWVKVVNEDQDEDDDPAEYNYYYMQATGKAYKGDSANLRKKTIDGKQYAFDDDGKMLYGWVNKDGSLANGEDDWATADYYFGGWEDGSLKTGWQKISVYDNADGKEDDYDYWFNFKSNGQKRTHTDTEGAERPDGTNKTWRWSSNGKYYHFDTRGVMVYEWFQVNATSSDYHSASNWAYFSSPEEGARWAKGWFKVAPPTNDSTFAETDLSFASDDSDDESDRWYYSDGKDQGLVAGQIKKIKGKYYGFWPEDSKKSGRMLTGLCALKMNKEDGSKIDAVIEDDMDSDKLDAFMKNYKGKSSTTADADSNVYLYYFGNSADTDGALKTGNVTINLDGTSYQFMFKKTGGADSRGRSVNGVDDGKYIYKFGQKVKADSDEKYILVKATGSITEDNSYVIDYEGSEVRNKFASESVPTGNLKKDVDPLKCYYGFSTEKDNLNYYLVNTSGRVQTGTKTGTKDGDDMYWFMYDGKIKMYADDKNVSDYEKLKVTKKDTGWHVCYDVVLPTEDDDAE